MLILLDIDGVMVQAAPWKKVEFLSDGFYQFMPHAVKNLAEILSKTEASVVLTTSHKFRYTLAEWEDLFCNRGIITKIDRLDDNVNLLSRKDEILNWITKDNHLDDYVIIDDDKSLHDLPLNIKEKVVFTQPLIGLNSEDVLKALDILGSSS